MVMHERQETEFGQKTLGATKTGAALGANSEKSLQSTETDRLSERRRRPFCATASSLLDSATYQESSPIPKVPLDTELSKLVHLNVPTNMPFAFS